MKRLRITLFALLLFMISTVSSFATEGIQVERIHGTTRYETAIAISKEAFNKSSHAVIASGDSFPDALSASQYAIALDAPILLVSKQEVPQAVYRELKRLGVENITIAGGVQVISEEVETFLEGQFSEVNRLSGATRYLTNVSFMEPLKQLFNNQGIQGPMQPWYVSGENFPDALTAAPYTAQLSEITRTPQFLALKSPKDSLAAGEFAIGGKSVLPGDPSQRISGATRYQTAVEIAKRYQTDLAKTIDTVYLASGVNFPDALSVSPLLVQENAVLLLTKPHELPSETLSFIRDNDIHRVVVLGGEGAVHSRVLEELNKEPSSEIKTTVSRVVDGDTFIATIAGVEERIRLIGIDAPESVHPDDQLNSEMGRIASQYTKELLTGKDIHLELDVQERDHYGRILAYAYLGDQMVNKVLLSAGMAQLATYPPNVRYVDEFRVLEQVARENRVGLWGDIETDEPAPPIVEEGEGYGKRGLDYRWVDAQGNPLIKGNINAKGVKIYHTPNSPSYNKTVISPSKGERYFYTEREAIGAGWRAPRR